jgi:hypothetical protein
MGVATIERVAMREVWAGGGAGVKQGGTSSPDARSSAILAAAMEIFLSVTAMGIAIAVLLLLAGRLRPGTAGSSAARRPAVRAGAAPGAAGAARSCPLCGATLAPGERIHSDITPGKGDRIMRIFGCPHCYPSSPGQRERLCPVCGGQIEPKGYAIARYFERPGRKHVHVLGCTGCRIG